MEDLSLQSQDIYKGVLFGALSVMKERNLLNKINVFPVPDGDTGTNLYSTMQSIVKDAVLHDTVEDTLESIADAALMGARGNSGLIFAGFFQGLYREVKHKGDGSIDTFNQSVKGAVPYAYQAVANPVEGTMISVIREWAQSLYDKQLGSREEWVLHLKQSLTVANQALEQTPQKLKVLKEAKVVDSGAKGFVAFLQGFVQYMETPTMDLLEAMQAQAIQLEAGIPKSEGERVQGHAANEDAPYGHAAHQQVQVGDLRFCTEGVIALTSGDEALIKRTLEGLGDSLIVAGAFPKYRFHIHTNHPDQVFVNLHPLGKMIEQKVDDMFKQQAIVNHRKYPIALVTDSIADLPEAWMDEWQIHRVPLQLMMDDVTYFDRLTILPQTFYTLLPSLKTYPSSSLPSLKSVINQLNYLSTFYESIIILSVAKGLSGTYHVFEQAAEVLRAQGVNLCVVDTRQNSVAQGLIVSEVAQGIAQGMDFKAVETLAKGLTERTKIIVTLDTLDYMVRSGRVSPMKGKLAKVFGLKPLVSLDEDGKGTVLGASVSRKASTKRLLKLIDQWSKEQGRKVKRYALVHAQAQGAVNKLELACRLHFEQAPDYVNEISAITAMSAGIGAVAIGVVLEEVEG